MMTQNYVLVTTLRHGHTESTLVPAPLYPAGKAPSGNRLDLMIAESRAWRNTTRPDRWQLVQGKDRLAPKAATPDRRSDLSPLT